MDQGEIIWIQRENSGCKVSNLIEDLEQKLQMMMMMTLSPGPVQRSLSIFYLVKLRAHLASFLSTDLL